MARAAKRFSTDTSQCVDDHLLFQVTPIILDVESISVRCAMIGWIINARQNYAQDETSALMDRGSQIIDMLPTIIFYMGIISIDDSFKCIDEMAKKFIRGRGITCNKIYILKLMTIVKK